MYEITDEMLGRPVVSEVDLKRFPDEMDGYAEYDSVRPKFDSVGALVAFRWSMDSGQDRDCGTSELGNGWSALFESERLVLRTDGQGFIWAYRIEDGADMDTVWAELEAGARYEEF